MMRRIFMASFIWTLAITSTALGAGEHPDELYQKGRFDEAEKAYAEEDMDHPKDIRFRYNRGCAAYQKADFDGAAASFSSVLKRADSDETRFKATFNLGNTAFKKGDLSSSVAYFKQALALKPDSEDARVNLELALREMEKNKGSQKEQPAEDASKDASRDGNSNGEQNEKKKDDPARQDEEKKESSSEPETTPPADQTGRQQDEQKEQDKASSDRQSEEPEEQQPSQEPQREPAGQETDRDLSGRLEPMEAMPQQEKDEPDTQTGRELDRRKAEAFLNNVKEDRSRFLQYQMGERQGRGAASGKDW